jgi:hypothetical protein
MKRLIRKAEFYNADYIRAYCRKGQTYVEVFFNPTSTEFRELDSKCIDKEQDVRMFLTPNGDLYAWDGEVMHFEAKNLIKNDTSNYIHIDYNSIDITFSDIGVSEEFIETIKKAKDKFNYCGISSNISIEIAGYGNLGNLSDCKTLEDIYNL